MGTEPPTPLQAPPLPLHFPSVKFFQIVRNFERVFSPPLHIPSTLPPLTPPLTPPFAPPHAENFRREEFLGSSIVRQNEPFDLYYWFRVSAALV